MEHLLFLLIEFVIWLDRRSLKPLNRAVPNLDELRSRPAAVLAEGDVVIGPFRRWGSSITFGLLVALGIILLGVLLLASLVGLPLPNDPVVKVLLGLFLLGTPVLAVVIMLQLLQGGRMVLRTSGVEMNHRGTVVLCPWSLFDADGTPFQPARDRVMLPVDPRAVPLVEAHRDERPRAQGLKVDTRPLRFKAPNLAELRGLYEVEVAELGELLLQLGRRLGPAQPRKAPAHWEAEIEPEDEPGPQPAAALVRRADGWLRASLVRLSFPPYCCACGCHTAQRREHHVDLLQAGDFARLEVPICTACQRAQARARHAAVAWGIAWGIASALALAMLLSVLAGDPLLFALVLFPLSLLGAVLGWLIGRTVGTARTTPVRLRDYEPSEGTVLLWFRNPDYADALMEILGGEEEAEPEPAADVFAGHRGG